MKISVSDYSLRSYINGGKMTHRDVVRCAHELGFDGIEFTNFYEKPYEQQVEDAKFFREEAAKYGMDIVALAVGANMYKGSEEEDNAEIEYLRGQLEIAKHLGAPVMRHDIVYTLGKKGATRSFDLMLPTIAKNVRRVAEIAEEMGIMTCTENHGFISQDSDRIERLVAAVNHDNFGVLVDIGNFTCADENHAIAVSRLANLAVHVHAKDFHIIPFKKEPVDGYFKTRGCNYIRGCTIGDGDVPVAQCIDILRQAGYDGYISIEYEGAEDCLVGLKRGREYLESVIR